MRKNILIVIYHTKSSDSSTVLASANLTCEIEREEKGNYDRMWIYSSNYDIESTWIRVIIHWNVRRISMSGPTRTNLSYCYMERSMDSDHISLSLSLSLSFSLESCIESKNENVKCGYDAVMWPTGRPKHWPAVNEWKSKQFQSISFISFPGWCYSLRSEKLATVSGCEMYCFYARIDRPTPSNYIKTRIRI